MAARVHELVRVPHVVETHDVAELVEQDRAVGVAVAEAGRRGRVRIHHDEPPEVLVLVREEARHRLGERERRTGSLRRRRIAW